MERTSPTSCSKEELEAAIDDAVRAALADPGEANWADGMIARSTGASVELVAEIRRGPAVLSPAGATIAEAARHASISVPMMHLVAAFMRRDGDGDGEQLIADFEAGRLDLSKAARSRFVLAEGGGSERRVRAYAACPGAAGAGPRAAAACHGSYLVVAGRGVGGVRGKGAALPPSSPLAV